MNDLELLAKKRLHLSTIHAGAGEWEALAAEYRAIGALCNMTSCQRRAEQARVQAQAAEAQVEFIPAAEPVAVG